MQQEALDRVICGLYESLLVPERRLQTIDSVIGCLGYRQGVWWIPHDEHPARSTAAYTGDPAAVELYRRDYATIDRWQAELLQRPEGVATPLSRRHNETHYARDRCYNEFMRGVLGICGVYTMPVRHHRGQVAHFTVHQEPDEPEPGDRVAAILDHLGPHLRQFHLLYQEIETLRGERRELSAALDGFRCAVLGVDAGMRIVLTNAAADRTLSTSPHLLASRGRLSAPEPEDDIALGRLVVDASAGSGTGPGGTIRIGGKTGPIIRVTPVRDEAAALHGRSATALVFISDPRDFVGDRERGMREALGFTAGEARIANGLLNGRSIREIADRHGLREQTVRYHTKSLFRKTGTRRQGELVHFLVTAFGMHGSA